ncbi:hypothetical protein N7638_17165 [Achromobacter mucicolens]|uniref:Uncharacterized protein n=1 Tax=Achromobacter aegrifaciens TaxID=1287736 RepID=A0AAD2J4S2_ACHAE|nr:MULTISPECIES: hypothetical protein [Achromobacter]MDG9969774.1 hypothetical protein [Achromobacter mucicolens]CAB3893267.1 hypothetical protein LMG26684_04210 [Achromobacter mucicolens]CUJ71293.1 Uncharacterised protein [Achromobacter aegrifaciens]
MNLVRTSIHTIFALIAFGAFASFVRMLWHFQVEFLEAVAGSWFYPAGAVLYISGWMLLALSVVATVKPTSHMVVRLIFCAVGFLSVGIMNVVFLPGITPDRIQDAPKLWTFVALLIIATPWIGLAGQWADVLANREQAKSPSI